MHCFFTLWTFSNQRVFPSERSEYASLLQEMGGFSETTYRTVMYAYRTGTDSYQDSHYGEYIVYRLADWGRKGCWTLYLFFLIMLIYYGSIIMWKYVLLMLLQPFKLLVKLFAKRCCKRASRVDKALLSESNFPLQSEDMLKSTGFNSYLLKNNEYYKEAYDAVSIATIA